MRGEPLRPPKDTHAHGSTPTHRELTSTATRAGESRVAHSMSPRHLAAKTRTALNQQAARIATWNIWAQPRRVRAFVWTAEALVAAAVISELGHSNNPTQQNWIQFTVLLTAAHTYQRLTRNQEERRRARTGSSRPHGDLTSIYFFPAAVLLPLWLTITLVATVRWGRYLIARQPPFRFIMTTTSIIAAAMSAHYIVVWTHRYQPHDGAWRFEFYALLIIIAGICYVVQQVLIVAILKLLSAQAGGRLTRMQLFGSREHFIDLGTAIGLAILLACIGASVFATVVVTFIAISVHNLLADREVGRRDGGTGLATKARWTELATQALLDAPGQGEKPGLLIIDLDHFKQVNDRYHHLVGDMLLREVANELVASVRPEDIVGRFGGEEFVVFLRDGENATEIAERIRQRVQGIDLVFTRSAGGEPVILSNRTASIGIALAGVAGAGLEALLASADSALYKAKASGRNRVVGPLARGAAVSKVGA